MNVFCTLSDINYLDRGIALYESLLEKSSEPFALYYLCLDEETYSKIEGLNLALSSKKIIPISLKSLEENNEVLLEAKKDRDAKDYMFTLASYFSDYLINSVTCDSVLYIDADVYFYEDPYDIIKCCEGKHCGIMLHRHNFVGHRDGGYNVGVVWFNNSSQGKEVLSWWKNAVLKKEPKELSIMGDQKYLEAFEPNFGKDVIKIIDEDIGHGAPWNFRLYVYDEFDDKNIIGWGDKKQKLVFNHFSQFKYSEEKGGFTPDQDIYRHLTLNGTVFLLAPIYKMYSSYYKKLLEVKEKWL